MTKMRLNALLRCFFLQYHLRSFDAIRLGEWTDERTNEQVQFYVCALSEIVCGAHIHGWMVNLNSRPTMIQFFCFGWIAVYVFSILFVASFSFNILLALHADGYEAIVVEYYTQRKNGDNM